MVATTTSLILSKHLFCPRLEAKNNLARLLEAAGGHFKAAIKICLPLGYLSYLCFGLPFVAGTTIWKRCWIVENGFLKKVRLRLPMPPIYLWQKFVGVSNLLWVAADVASSPPIGKCRLDSKVFCFLPASVLKSRKILSWILMPNERSFKLHRNFFPEKSVVLRNDLSFLEEQPKP